MKDAGFSTADTTWLPVAPDYLTVNVKTEQGEPLLRWYERLIAMRRDDPTLRDGKQVMLDKDNPSVLSYMRKGVGGNPSIVVAPNFTAQTQIISLDRGEQEWRARR